TFTRHFQKYIGTTPKQWLLQMKKRNVVQQLRNTGRSFTTIAKNLGFSSASHLYHFCVNKIGKTPSEIRSNK
ncbi:MAG: helix-turn-helix transcriptional regulator, partial [Proteiniphilum sp.]|nr:helix-turn-helix transcriptional regulator [Proteiniphilum sp.]